MLKILILILAIWTIPVHGATHYKNSLIDSGIKKELAIPIVEQCKKLAKDPIHCIKKISSISMAESGGGWKCIEHNCTGLAGGRFHYKTYTEGVIDWVHRYNKYWYKTKSMSDFYPPKGKKSKTMYCTSEESSNSKVGCPNGLKHSSEFHEKLNKLF